MAHSITIEGNTKEERYRSLVPQIEALLEGEQDMVARMSNTAAAIHGAFGFLWTGFYRVVTAPSGSELSVGPFQGPAACSRVAYGKGVCGTAWKENRTLVVPDVDAFPGHIACSSLSRSEIVVPIIYNKEIKGVLDIDSDQPADFDDTDREGLENIMRLMAETLYS